MAAPWTLTSIALPSEDSLVEFLLEDRESPLWGTYHRGRFESRWYFYAPPRVYRWRDLVPQDLECEAPSASRIRRQRRCLADAERLAAAA